VRYSYKSTPSSWLRTWAFRAIACKVSPPRFKKASGQPHQQVLPDKVAKLLPLLLPPVLRYGKVNTSARPQKRRFVQQRTLSRAGPWCCIRTHSLFICEAGRAREQTKATECAVKRVRTSVKFCRMKSTASCEQNLKSESGAASSAPSNAPAHCRLHPRTRSRCQAADSC